MGSVSLGDKVRDPITGYEGTVIARTEWVWGCVRLGVQSAFMHEGKPVEAQWFDEAAIEVTSARLVERKGAATGGPARPGESSSRSGE